MLINMPDPKYIIAEYPDGSKRLWAGAPIVGQSPYTPKLLADLDSEWKPVQAKPAVAPTPTPVVPAVTILRAPPTANRRTGIAVGAAGLSHTRVIGYSQNIVVEAPGASVLIDACQSVDSWRDEVPVDAPDKAHHGQALYGFHAKSIAIRNSYFARAGWAVGKPLPERNRYRHCLYNGDDAGDLILESVILANAASCGGQHRGNGLLTATNFICWGNAFGFIVKAKAAGTSTITGGAIFCNGWNTDVNGQNKPGWNGACGIFAETDTLVDDVDIFLPPKMGSPDGGWVSDPVASMGKVRFGLKVRIHNWPNYDPSPIFAAVENMTMSVADAVAKIRADAAKLA